MKPKDRMKIIDFLNKTTNEELVFLLQCIGDKIIVNIHTDEDTEHFVGCTSMEICEPFSDINLNGMFLDIYIKL